MKRAEFAELVTCLTGDQPPRVWSLLVTVFGELAQEDGARISGALLRHLSDLIGFKPEAVRVALHRLRKDGWIDSRRIGRNSDYGLTAWGRAQSAAATPRIYAEGPLADTAWLVVSDPGAPLSEPDREGVWLTSYLRLTPQRPDDPGALIAPVTQAVQLPDWMRAKLCGEGLTGHAQALLQALTRIETQAAQLTRLAPCERAALRVLIVHDWRRIALRTPVLPDAVFPADWPGPQCRETVAQVLRLLPRQNLDVLLHALETDPPPGRAR